MSGVSSNARLHHRDASIRTSLLEQIIASHPQADGAGERRDPFLLLEDLMAETRTDFPSVLESASLARLDAAAESYLSMLDEVVPGGA